MNASSTKQWIARFALLGLALAPAMARGEHVAADLHFRLIDNRVFLPATLNGHGPYQMLLDTGADVAGVSLDVLREIGAPVRGREQLGGAGENTEAVTKTEIGSVRLGGAAFRDWPAIALGFGAHNAVIGFQRFDGVAGQQVFRRYVVDIDFARTRLTLIEPKDYRAPAGAIVVPFTFYDGYIPLVRGAIAGVRGKFMVDLGDRSSLTLFGSFWRGHGLDDKLGPGIDALTGYGLGGPVRGLVVRVPGFSFGAATAKGVVARLSLQASGGFADTHIAGSIGAGLLRRFRTIFDYPHSRILLLPQTAQPDRYDRAGMWLGRHGAQFEVFDVVAGGPAEVAGLRKGDVVTQIDRRKVETLDLFAVREELRDPRYNEPLLVDFLRGSRAGQATLRLRDQLPGG